MSEKSKKFLSFFTSEKILMETLSRRQARLYSSLRKFVVDCNFNFSLAITYLIKKERITKNLDSELIEVVNIFKSIHNSADKHPTTLLTTLSQVDSNFITETCQYYADKKSKKSVKDRLIPKLPLLKFYNNSINSDSDSEKDQLDLKNQCDQEITEPLDIFILKDVDKDIVKDIKEKNKKEKNKSKKFIPPTLEEVTAYCQERHNNVDPQKFLDHYESVGWKKSTGTKVVNWQACVRTWEGRNYGNSPPKKTDDTWEYMRRVINGEDENEKIIDVPFEFKE